METFDITARPRARHHAARGQRRHRQDVDDRRARHQATSPRARSRLDEMLVVTFTRAASQELRERVRRQLDEAVAGARRPGAARPRQPAARLAARRRRGRASRAGCGRLTAALVSFDAATIATIHQFCQLVLRSLGVAGDTDSGGDPGRGPRAAHDRGRRRPLPRPLRRRGEAAVVARRRPSSSLAPWSATRGRGRRAAWTALTEAPDSAAAMRVPLRVRRARRGRAPQAPPRRAQLRRPPQPARRRARGHRRPRPPARMRQRWKFVLIDEFQDTDPVQWQVFQRAFADVDHDGADRRPQAGHLRLPRRRHRHLPRRPPTPPRPPRPSASTGAPTSPCSPALQAAARGRRPRRRADRRPPRRGPLRGVPARGRGRAVPAPRRTPRGARQGPAVQAPASATVARARHHRPRPRHQAAASRGDGRTFDGRDLVPGRHRRARARRRNELDRQRRRRWPRSAYPSVHQRRRLGLPHAAAAGEWLTLLEALEQPHRADRVRAAALTSFFGYTAEALDAGGDDLTDALSEPRTHAWPTCSPRRGVAAVLEATVRRRADRAGARPGRRRAHAHRPAPHRRGAAPGQRRGAARHRRAARLAARAGRRRQARGRLRADPAARLRRRRRAAGDDPRQQGPAIPGRLPPDAVGPLRRATTRTIPLFHDDDRASAAATSAGRARSTATRSPATGHEDAGESLRLLYVALTRAQSQVVAWYCPGRAQHAPPRRSTGCSSGAARGCAPVPDEQALVVEDDEMVDDPRPLAVRRRPAPSRSPRSTPPDPTPLERGPADALSVRAFDRAVDTAWRRTSYSVALRRRRRPRGRRPIGRCPSRRTRPSSTTRLRPATTPAHPSDVELGGACRRRWPTCRWGRRSARWCTRCSSTPIPPRPTSAPSCSATSPSSCVWWPVDLDAEALADALVAVCD